MKRRLLVACEFSGIVRDAFAALGWDAWSCDIVPSERPGQHIQGNVLCYLDDGWDLMIAHPPCTFLSYAGMRWFKTQPDRWFYAYGAFGFFMRMVRAPIPNIAIENPRGLTTKWYKKPDQVIQPWQFGDPMTKTTGLWLKKLPPLLYTNYCTDPFVNWTEHGHRTQKERSRTFQGIANAMAIQWTAFLDQSD